MKRIITLLFVLVMVCGLSAQQTTLVKKTPADYNGPRVGVVLGGGGAKGAAHIGVLKYLEEIGIPVSYVTGTSMGSIIGGLYALGYEPDELADIIASADWTRLMSNAIERRCLSNEHRYYSDRELVSVPFGSGKISFSPQDIVKSLPAGIINSSNIENLFCRLSIGYTDSIDFNSLPIPYACVAIDIITGDSVIIRKGSFPKAIRSSMAIPGVFAPVQWNNYLLADGGLVDNFPVDVCKEMGADIIIGVELASDLADSPEKLKSLPQMLSQYMALSTKGDRFKHREMCDVYVHPDVTGFNMLSFSDASIDSLVRRGYEQAARQHDEFVAIKAKLDQYGNTGKHLGSPKAIKKLDGDTVRLGAVNFYDVSVEEIDELSRYYKALRGDVCTVDDIEAFVNRLRGTGYYNNVKYTLRPTDEADVYDMDVNLTPAKPHRIGFGFRFDNEESAAILFHFGYNELRTAGFKALLDLDLCYNFGLNAHLLWDIRKIGNINLDYRLAQFRFTTVNLYASNYYGLLHRLRLYYSNDILSGLSFKVGTTFESVVDVDFLKTFNALNISDYKISYNTVGLFSSIAFDNRDDAYFPNKGIALGIDASMRFVDTNLFGGRWKKTFDMDNPFYTLRLSLTSALTIGDRLSFIPMLGGRMVFNKELDNTKIWYENCAGGAFEGRYLEQLFPFVGVSSPILADEYMGLARLDLRYRFGEKIYLSAMANVLYSRCPRVLDINNYELYDLHAESQDMWVQGYGLRVAYKSSLGPIFFDLMWNDITKKLSGYINIGYYF